MLKKSLLSLAVSASLVGLTGCNISSTTDNAGSIDQTPVDTGSPDYIAANADKISTTFPLFNPAKTLETGLPEIPVTSDLLFKGDPDGDGYIDKDGSEDYNFGDVATKDGTIPLALGDIALGATGYNPIFNAAADLDGFSTTAQIDIPFNKGIDPTTATAATVFVIPLTYPADSNGSTDPLTSESTPIPGAPVAIDVSVITYAASEPGESSYTLANASANGSGNVLRISPSTPLSPATRYIIVLTNGIKGLDGLPVVQAPTYSLLSSSADIFTSQDDDTRGKAALQEAIQGYEAAAEGVWSVAGVDYTADNIVYSFSFTTGGTTAVLSGMAAPANVVEGISPGKGESFNISLPATYRMTMETSLRAGNTITDAATTTYGTIKAHADGSDLTAQGILAALEQQALGLGMITAESDAAAIATAQVTLIGSMVTIHDTIPSPAPRVSDFSGGTTAVNLGLGGNIRHSNGTISLPSYLVSVDVDLPASVADYSLNAAGVFDFWNADDTLGTDLAAVLAGAGVDAEDVAAPSSNVTRLFPLAKVETYVDVPVTVTYDTTCAGQYTPVMFMHGITADRTSSFGVGANLATQDECLATIAIDLPKHGLTNDADVSATSAGALALFGESVYDQRHFGLKRVDGIPSSPFPMVDDDVDTLTGAQEFAALAAIDAEYDPQIAAATGDEQTALQTAKATAVATAQAQAAGANTLAKAQPDTRGDFFINLESFQSTRDNMRQAVMDYLNLNASLAFIDFDNDATPDFDTSKVHFIGHSLGAILGSNFVAINNSVGASATAKAVAAGGECGTCNNMLPEITTATLANPGAGVVSLLENSPTFGPTIVGGMEALGLAAEELEDKLDLSQGSYLYELTKNIFQATVDSADPLNFAAMLAATGTPIFTAQIVGDGTETNKADQVIPTDVTADSALTITGKTYSALPAPLAGSDPLISLLDQTQVSSNQDTDAALNVVVKYTEGSHSSFADPSLAAHSDMMTQLFSFIDSDGQDITIGNAPVQAAQ